MIATLAIGVISLLFYSLLGAVGLMLVYALLVTVLSFLSLLATLVYGAFKS